MITFWVSDAGSFGIEEYLALRAPQLAGRVQVRRYESLTPELELDTGAHIFSALDQLTPAGREAVTILHDRLAPSCAPELLLNNPRKFRRRGDLLRMFFEAGINTFNAYRVTDSFDAIRYPVFVREESEHNGAVTGLITGRRDLVRALRALRGRGFRSANLLIVELCDLSDPEGLFHTASAFKVGEYIVPAHLLRGRHWMLKWTESDHGEQALRENLEFVTGNPHGEWLRRIFALAGIDYGRIDYGVRGDTLQVWEINTNPTLGPPRQPPAVPLAPGLEALLMEARTTLRAGLLKGFQSLDSGADTGTATVRLEPRLISRIRAETVRAGRRASLVRFLQRLYSGPMIGKLFRRIYARLLPRP